MSGEPAARPARVGALRHRRFALFWVGLLTAHTGVWMQTVGQGWLVYQLTNTPVWLGVTSLAFALPTIVVPLASGALADRVDRLMLVRATQVFSAAAVGALALVTYLGVVRVWHIVAYTLLQGLSLSFEGPARHAVIPQLVDRDSLLGAVSLSQSSYQIGGFIGPALAGVLLGAFGTERLYVLFAVNACTFLIFAGVISLIRTAPGVRASAVPVAGSVADGLRYVWGREPLRALMLLITVVAVFGRSYVTLLPVFARDILHTTADGLGFLTAAPGVGVIAGAAVLSAAATRRRPGPMFVVTAVLYGALLAGFTASRAVPLSMAILMAHGFISVTLIASLSAALQLAAPDALRGRVMSLWTIANVGLQSAGAMVTAGAAAVIGAPLAVAAGAGLVAATALALAQPLRHLE
jgi:MFS family permease